MKHVTTGNLAHLACDNCSDAAMKLIAKAPEMFGEVLSNTCVTGLRYQFEGCHLACWSNIKRNQGLHQGKG